LFKLKNLQRWSFFTLVYNRSSNMNDDYIYFTSNRKMIPFFYFQKQIQFIILSPHWPWMNKKSMREVKKNCELSVHGTLNPALFPLQWARQTWPLNVNSFFKEAHHLTKFT